MSTAGLDEAPRHDIHSEEPDEIVQYREVMTRLRVHATAPEDTPAVLRRILKEIT